MTSGKAFEADVRELLERTLPAATLSGVCLFQMDQFVDGKDFGSEIDHLLHFHAEDGDHLFLIECKAQPVQFRGSASSDARKEWVVHYSAEPKYLKKQLFAQAQALLQNLYPRESFHPVTVHAMVVSPIPSTPVLKVESAPDSGIYFYLSSLAVLRDALENPKERLTGLLGIPPARWRTLRVQQSDILRKVRHSLILPELGHPEVPNGMRYVARCRETLDCKLTQYFRPTSEGRWVINGGAGMGKTVLLAYSAVVFATDHVIVEKRADRQVPKRELVAWTSRGILEKLPNPARRRVVLLGLNRKQAEILSRERDRFADEYRRIADSMDEPHLGTIPRLPCIEVWRPGMRINADVLLIDEAHDLSPAGQAAVREWWEQGKGSRYLILACDRHQKLRLLGEHASILEGMSFSGCSVRLTRNYRSPSPIYGAALALMFRWFGKGGIKVVPAQSDLEEHFGFSFRPGQKLPDRPGDPVVLRLLGDVHPANYWCFTVARYTHWQTAYNWIKEWGLNGDQVLWVRFSHTDQDLAQQDLELVQLRDLMGRDPDHVIDAHIKGREFPVVVIEGLPDEGVDQSSESEMLLWRRRLYLCASRATCFLFFVYPTSDGSFITRSWNEELITLLDSCSAPVNRTEASSKFWELTFDFPETLRRPEVFVELEKVAVDQAGPELPQRTSPIEAITTPKAEVTATSDSAPMEPPSSVAANRTQTDEVPVLEVRMSSSSVTQAVTNSDTSIQQPIGELAAAKPVRMTEKEFQRQYGQEKGWKQLYQRYLESGALPIHMKPRIKTVAGVAAGPKPQPQATRVPAAPAGPPQAIRLQPLVITPRMISKQLDVKPFRVLKAVLEILKASGSTSLPQLDTPIAPKHVQDVYRHFERAVPGRPAWEAVQSAS